VAAKNLTSSTLFLLFYFYKRSSSSRQTKQVQRVGSGRLGLGRQPKFRPLESNSFELATIGTVTLIKEEED
jgi:hypothetical protein